MTAFQLLIDTAQTRLKEDSLSTLVTGMDWDPTVSSNVYLDGVTNTMMLTPAPKQAGWTSSNSGIFAKWGLSDFTLTDSANWENQNFDTGGAYLHYAGSGGNTSGVGGTSNASLSANQPMVIEWFNPNTQSNIGGVFECGWGDPAINVSLRFYADGKAEVWEGNTNLAGQYSISGKSQNYFDYQAGQMIPNAPTAQYVTVMLIPGRGRELMVIGSTGGGFSHIFESIPEGTTSPVITPAGTFWFNVPAPVDANVRVSILQFESSGTAVGSKSFWRYELPSDAVVAVDVYQDPDSPAAVGTHVDGVNPSNPYSDNTNGVRLSLALTGGPSQSSLVYGARGYTLPETAQTSANDSDATKFIQDFGLDYGDNISAVSGHVTFAGPLAMNAAGIPSIESQSYRPMQALADGSALLAGILVKPKFVDSSGINDNGRDLNRDVQAEIKDFWQMAEDYQFSDPIVLDGMPLDEAYQQIAETAGFTVNVSSDYHSFLLPAAGTPTGGKFNVQVKAGDKCSEWLDRLHKTYAGTDYHGIAPDGTFEMLKEADLPTSPAVTLYETIQLALSAGFTLDQAPKYVFRSLDQQVLEPEANDIYVTGMDFRTRRPIVVHKRDAASADPTTPPASKPANWLGFLRKYGWVDPAITTLDAATYCIGLLYNRLTQQRLLIEVECEFQCLTRKDLVQLNFVDGSTITGRIKTTSMSVVNADDRFTIWRPARYTLQAGTDASSTFTTSKSAKGISNEWSTRLTSKTMLWDKDIRDFIGRPFISAFAS